jgi:hypothetical protein
MSLVSMGRAALTGKFVVPILPASQLEGGFDAMRLMKPLLVSVAGLLVLGGLGVAFAQTGGAVTPPPAEVGAQRDVTLTPVQMQTNVEKFLPQMEQGQNTVRRQLERARQQRDVVKTLCLNDKLTQIDVALRTSRDRYTSLRAAVARADGDRSKHEYTVLQVLRDRIRALVSEANQCIGEETGFIGESRVTVDIDPNIPDTDPSEFPESPLISDPPTLSSPTS